MRLLTLILASAALLRPLAPQNFDRCKRVQHAAEECQLDVGGELRYINSDNVLCIDKDITTPDGFIDRLKSAHVRNGVIVDINSYGGDVQSFIDLANYLSRLDYRIVVSRKCLSSCGQFIFLASSNRFIVGDGQVLMHGVPYSDGELISLNVEPTMKTALKRVNAKFRDFLTARHIPERLLIGDSTSTGRIVGINGVDMWMPSLRDYRSNGIAVTECNALRYKSS